MSNELMTFDKEWPVLPYPCDYKTILSAMTKQELSEIRKAADIRNASQLNKTALIEKLAAELPQQLQQSAQQWDEERYVQFKALLSKQGFSTNNYMNERQAKYFRDRGVMFQGTVEGRKGLIMPKELVEYFGQRELALTKETMVRNTRIVQLVRGMLYYYGLLSYEVIVEKVAMYLNEEKSDKNLKETFFLLDEAKQYYLDISYTTDVGYHYLDVLDPFVLRDRIAGIAVKYEALDYYPYTADQLIDAAQEFYFERTEAYKAFMAFLMKHYDMEEDEANIAIISAMSFIRRGDPVQDGLNGLQLYIEFPPMPLAKELFAKFSDLINTSSQWVLKGHTPNGVSDIFGGGARAMAEMPQVESKKKIGRNDPCLCGSGKKFKKCCMA